MTENKGQQDRPAPGKRGDGNDDSSGRRRKSKRRYFRRKRQDDQAKNDQPSGAQKSPIGQDSAPQPRKSRRKRGGRRSSRRPHDGAVETPENPEFLAPEEESYTESVEVYIYTYVVRPNY